MPSLKNEKKNIISVHEKNILDLTILKKKRDMFHFFFFIVNEVRILHFFNQVT